MRVEPVAVLGALDGHVPGEAVLAVRPPEPGPSVEVEGDLLVLLRLAGQDQRREVVVEDVVDLGAALEEIAVADALVAHVVADHEGVGAVDRDPAVVAVPDRGPDDRAAPHGLAGQVEVDAVAALLVPLAEVAELGVVDRAGRVPVVHRVAADPVGIGRLDHHVAGEVRDLGPEIPLGEVGERQRPIEPAARIRR